MTIAPAIGNAQDAYVWANDATAERYTPNAIYAFNPRGNISIARQGTGQYSVTFFGLGTDATGTSGEGGHVQITTYGSSDRCNIRHWEYRGENFLVNVSCFEPGSSAAKDSQFALSVTNRPFGLTTYSFDINNYELQALQAAVAELSVRVGALEAP